MTATSRLAALVVGASTVSLSCGGRSGCPLPDCAPIIEFSLSHEWEILDSSSERVRWVLEADGSPLVVKICDLPLGSQAGELIPDGVSVWCLNLTLLRVENFDPPTTTPLTVRATLESTGQLLGEIVLAPEVTESRLAAHEDDACELDYCAGILIDFDAFKAPERSAPPDEE